MIARLTGTVIDQEANALIIDVQGVGYRVIVGKKLFRQGKIGETMTFRIHYHITDDKRELYGFAEVLEQQYFELLLTVPSIGAKTARNILDVADTSVLEQAVAQEDITLLTKVSGVGKRTAERIIVELKEKIAAPSILKAGGSLQHDTIEALVSIGFTPNQARSAAGKLPSDVKTVADAIKLALKATAH